MQGMRRAMSVFGALALALPCAWAQAGGAAEGPRAILSSAASAQVLPGSRGEIVREIDDPHLGDRWFLERDPSHPGGPGRLLLAASARRAQQDAQAGNQAGTGAQAAVPVIHPGDRVVVEEHTRVVDARLEAVALNPAAVGSPFGVRLAMGGRTMRAVAVGPGRAVFAEGAGR